MTKKNLVTALKSLGTVWDGLDDFEKGKRIGGWHKDQARPWVNASDFARTISKAYTEIGIRLLKDFKEKR